MGHSNEVPVSPSPQTGEPVFFVEGKSIDGRQELTTKKGKFVAAYTPSGARPDQVRFRMSMVVEGAANPVGISHPAEEVFTEDQVLELMCRPDSPLASDPRVIDDVLASPEANRELTALLGSAVIMRMLEKELAGPETTNSETHMQSY